jgi:PhoH-like ATPase
MPLPKIPSKPASFLEPSQFKDLKPTRRLGTGKSDKAQEFLVQTATEPTAESPAASPAPIAARGPRAAQKPALTQVSVGRVSTGPVLAVPSAASQPIAVKSSAAPAPLAKGSAEILPMISVSNPEARLAKQIKGPEGKSSVQSGKAKSHRPKSVTATDSATRRLFVLDTNVLMHDPTSLFRFAEHDLFIPIMTLEELDNNKKGMSEVARNARQVSRSIDSLIAANGKTLEGGIPLSGLGHRDASGRLYLQTQALNSLLPAHLPIGKADNYILGVVKALVEQYPKRQVALVSKDINMRIKASALGLVAEDYFNDQVLEDSDLLYTGVLELPADFWDRHGKGIESWQQNGHTYYRITGPLVSGMLLNQFVFFEGALPLAAKVKELSGRTAVLQTLKDFTHLKNAVWGITARNREQNFAMNLLMDPDIDFVTLLGQAGTGKTLLALAAGLAQILEQKRYSEIIMTRATVPVGEDIGYLPGTEEEKMQPWMGALEDNLEMLNKGDPSAGEWGRAATSDLIRSRIKVKALSFMRGRTFQNKFLIIDEAQNLTPKQMKTLITRAGPGTKVLCMGNIAQIDTPYLTEGSSGITYVVDRFKGWAHSGHVTLQRGERSRLADFATEVL